MSNFQGPGETKVAGAGPAAAAAAAASAASTTIVGDPAAAAAQGAPPQDRNGPYATNADVRFGGVDGGLGGGAGGSVDVGEGGGVSVGFSSPQALLPEQQRDSSNAAGITPAGVCVGGGGGQWGGGAIGGREQQLQQQLLMFQRSQVQPPQQQQAHAQQLQLQQQQDAETNRRNGSTAGSFDVLGWGEEDHLREEGYDNEYDHAHKEDTKNTLSHGTRIRRKQLVESLEKAMVDMEADLKARAEEHQLSLKLREQWQQKMRDIALAILRRWWSDGEAIVGGGGGGGASNPDGGSSGWQDLLTDDTVAIAPAEGGNAELGTDLATKLPGLPNRARGPEQRMDGWIAVKAGAERMRVLRESLGHPTALGNLKLKVDVQVDHWALGERELMCQWRVETRNAAMCGGRRELETSGMMALYLWTSEDGLAPSVEPRSKPSTWSILPSPVDRPDPPLPPTSQTPPTTTATAVTLPTPSSCKKPAALSSSVLSVSRGPFSSSLSVVETANGGGGGGGDGGGRDGGGGSGGGGGGRDGVGRGGGGGRGSGDGGGVLDVAAACASATAAAAPAAAASACRTTELATAAAAAAAADSARRVSACPSSGLKGSRVKMEVGGSGGSGGAGGNAGGNAIGPAGSGTGTGPRTGAGVGTGPDAGTRIGTEINGSREVGVAAAAGVKSEEMPWRNSPRHEGMGGVTMTTAAIVDAAVASARHGGSDVDPSASGETPEAGAGRRDGRVERAASSAVAGLLPKEGGGSGRGAGGEGNEGGRGGGGRTGGRGGDGRGREGVGGGRRRGDGGSDYGTCLGSCLNCWGRDHKPLGKVVGVPRQAKARGVHILYDHSGFVRQLEESFWEETTAGPGYRGGSKAASNMPVDSSGEDAPSSRNVRLSTRSRRGRQGSGQSPCFASPARTRRAEAEKESSESGSPESEALDGGSNHSRGLSVPNEEHPKLPSPREEEAPPDSGARWQRQPASAASEEHQWPAQPRPVVAHRMGTSPPRRTDSSSAEMRLEQARRQHTAARETTLRRRRRLELNQRRVDDADRAERETSAELMSPE